MPSEPLSPESDIKSPETVVLSSQFRFRNICTKVCRLSPLPVFSWADSQEVWTQMLRKESQYIRKSNVFNRHPTLQPRMRSILLDWIIEVMRSVQPEVKEIQTDKLKYFDNLHFLFFNG